MKIFLFFLFPLFLVSHPHIEINDWADPSLEDFYLLQDYLENGERNELEMMHWRSGKPTIRRQNRMRNFSIIDLASGEIPQLHKEIFQTTDDDREYCIITYTSSNGGYAKGIDLILEGLKKVNYKGHFLYRIGGWPYIAEGGLELFDVPYAFKPCALMEARKLGYKKVLWIDASMVPNKDLTPLFQRLAKQGMIFRGDPVPLFRLAHDEFIQSMNTTYKEVCYTRHIMTGVVGFDFSYKSVNNILDDYYQAAQQRAPFFTNTPCQASLSVIIHRHRLTRAIFPRSDLLFSQRKNSYFRLDRTPFQRGKKQLTRNKCGAKIDVS